MAWNEQRSLYLFYVYILILFIYKNKYHMFESLSDIYTIFREAGREWISIYHRLFSPEFLSLLVSSIIKCVRKWNSDYIFSRLCVFVLYISIYNLMFGWIFLKNSETCARVFKKIGPECALCDQIQYM